MVNKFSKLWSKIIYHSVPFALIVSAIVDVVTTHLATSTHPNIALMETNPLKNIFGLSFPIFYLIKFLFIGLLVWIWYAPRRSERDHFFLTTMFCFLVFAQIFAGIGNYEIYQTYETHIDNPPMEVEVKNEYYKKFIIATIFIPFLIAFIPYMVFEWSFPQHKFKRRRL
tara:strand:- start:796 stop:1302 length:507 start_codon:yes stop_codon:yes gene_type:complete